ncbi:hypothetical protein TVAG_118100 [Trichomonas vaginalis G3]|uniref:DNA-directed RNA polymerase subunit n=1 Tax=Trichomonas vaginalis (strain ATCC PRA-98 / G3) TaxID=412133 RepID=A2EHZ7_TRIV3|nr:termination of RNA polymerase I transcription [Trichomonas vaginalis G3]EAY07729.1 hypothetical protein TVAG_118100 [Trichomonas vaginalis G3]KAI5552572.1 termination of RNA polymerase I transcription [Trichomonas vaginalis G3]|eukprot:XP_001319952.1 hypothetical protein [Trichomonas vaginalis G3]
MEHKHHHSQKAAEAQEEQKDPNLGLFCTFCGTLVPISNVGHMVCPLCKKAFDGKALQFSEKTVKIVKEADEITSKQGLARSIIKEKCPECGEEGLYFTTAQIRSADEGQTIFYECIHCGYRFSQNA